MKALFVAAFLAGIALQSPYAGEGGREIKALSEDQIAGYLNGDGMGYALPAELNGYPGPKHVLELADELELTAEQHELVTTSFEAMQVRAQKLGQRLVELEGDLDAAFADRSINEADLEAQLVALGSVNAGLRFMHLRAHLETTELLSAAQIEKYAMLRGYGEHSGHQGHQGHQRD